MIRVIECYGKGEGVEVELEKGDKVLFPKRTIQISPSLLPPRHLVENNIPEYVRKDICHYHASQYYYFVVDYRNQVYIKTGKFLTDEEINQDITTHLEREFRWLYYHQFKHDKTKII